MLKLYYNATIYLHRKYDLWQTLKNWWPFHAAPRKKIEELLNQQIMQQKQQLENKKIILVDNGLAN